MDERIILRIIPAFNRQKIEIKKVRSEKQYSCKKKEMSFKHYNLFLKEQFNKNN